MPGSASLYHRGHCTCDHLPSLPPCPPGDYYDRFVSKTLRNSTITVALMVPDPSGKTDMVRQVRSPLLPCLPPSLLPSPCVVLVVGA